MTPTRKKRIQEELLFLLMVGESFDAFEDTTLDGMNHFNIFALYEAGFVEPLGVYRWRLTKQGKDFLREP